MRLLKPEGLLAMVLPSYFLDNRTSHVREIIAHEGGSLLAAYRLPDDLFQDAKVTVDLVFLKKGDTGKAWVKTKHVPIGGKSQSLNEYYILHPEHILGNLEIVPIYDRLGLTCKRAGNPFSLLQKILKVLIQEKMAFVVEERDRIEEQSKALQDSFSHLFAQLRGVDMVLRDLK